MFSVGRTVRCVQPLSILVFERVPQRTQEFLKGMTFKQRFPNAQTARRVSTTLDRCTRYVPIDLHTARAPGTRSAEHNEGLEVSYLLYFSADIIE
jgi:hypothetical protein